MFVLASLWVDDTVAMAVFRRQIRSACGIAAGWFEDKVLSVVVVFMCCPLPDIPFDGFLVSEFPVPVQRLVWCLQLQRRQQPLDLDCENLWFPRQLKHSLLCFTVFQPSLGFFHCITVYGSMNSFAIYTTDCKCPLNRGSCLG